MRAGAALLHCYRDAVLAARDFNGTSLVLQTIGRDLWRAGRPGATRHARARGEEGRCPRRRHADRLVATMYTKSAVTGRPQHRHALRRAREERREQ